MDREDDMPARFLGGLFARGKKAETAADSDEEKPVVVNGYLQTSNTRVIRPVYSNTKAARKAQEEHGKLPYGKDSE